MSVYERLNLYTLTDKFFLEPCDRDGNILSNFYLEIDRHSNATHVLDSMVQRIPVIEADISRIYGILGTIQLVSGNALIIIRRAEMIGQLSGHEVWKVTETQLIPFKKTTLHLNEKQLWFEKRFIDMIEHVLSTGVYFYSCTLDMTHSLQWLAENAGPHFQGIPMIERAEQRFVWNLHLLKHLKSVPMAHRFCLPLMHGFFGSVRQKVNGRTFQLTLISRRSTQRAGVRFYKRGVNSDGHSANFVETEQIVEFITEGGHRQLTAFLQTRGSIPLFWSQRPNLRWQPCPTLRPLDDQLQAYVSHFETQKDHYGGKQVILNLVNQKGRERKVGGELERVSIQADLPFVRYHQFDFHKECHRMNWHRLSVLRDQLRGELSQFGFFASSSESSDLARLQTGIYRTNCMDCLDRTNVVQSVLARESLSDQLAALGILQQGQKVESVAELEEAFKHVWADNGDECSRQYAGTGALKADFTRQGKRTYQGAMNDAVNAISRYFRNNFFDGYRQDAIDLFLGNFQINPEELPISLEATMMSMDYHGVALCTAVFSGAMFVLCLSLADSVSVSLIWLGILLFSLSFIFLNGEEFVNTPKLKVD